MTAAWVNSKGYSPGSRHYAPNGVVATSGWESHIYNQERRIVKAVGLCGRTVSAQETRDEETGRPNRWHGISAVEKVNLMQRNLCGACIRRYLDARPNLKAAYDALKNAELDSED